MRRDSIYYQLFLQFPTLLFDLLAERPADADAYTFRSIEVKETSFRIDGVFQPPTPAGVIYFTEVQFQKDEILYERIFSEIGTYIYRYRQEFHDWRAVAIYPSSSIEQGNTTVVRELLASGRITRIYLDELTVDTQTPLGIRLMLLTTLAPQATVDQAKTLLRETQNSPTAYAIMEMIATIVVYRFNTLSRTEVEAMLGIELQQTRVYQEAKAEGLVEGRQEGRVEGRQEGLAEGRVEGRQEGLVKAILRLLQRKLGNLPNTVQRKIEGLSIAQLELLAEELLDFAALSDLETWLSSNQ
jgi:predicted transposase/invertase (TIGR01784 family)